MHFIRFRIKATMPKSSKESNGKKKSIYGKDGSSTNRQFMIVPGLAGIMVCCGLGKEQKAIQEVKRLFHHVAPELYPQLSNTDGNNEEYGTDHNNSKEEDIEAAFAKSIAHETTKQSTLKNLFVYRSTGLDCLAFFEVRSPIEPVAFVDYILNLYGQKENALKPPKFFSRLIPITETCYANMTDLPIAAKRVLEPHFHGSDEIPEWTFGVQYQSRANDKLKRDEVIKTLAELVGPRHKVELKTPQKSIVVQVLRSICGISVVDDYTQKRRLNVSAITESS